MQKKHKLIDPGTVFERLTVTKYIGKDKRGAHYYQCLCKCGEFSVVRSDHLLNHTAESCGCLRRDKMALVNANHGLTYHKNYSAWSSMMLRCKPNHKDRKLYYDRGITICQGFQDATFFITHMPDKPPHGWKYSLDRINNDEGYHCGLCPECIAKNWNLNVRWATAKEQRLNQRPRSLTLTTN